MEIKHFDPALNINKDSYDFSDVLVNINETFKIIISGQFTIEFEEVDASISHSFGTEDLTDYFVTDTEINIMTIYNEDGGEISISKEMEEDLKHELKSEIEILIIED